jgi:hypothetical protein
MCKITSSNGHEKSHALRGAGMSTTKVQAAQVVKTNTNNNKKQDDLLCEPILGFLAEPSRARVGKEAS